MQIQETRHSEAEATAQSNTDILACKVHDRCPGGFLTNSNSEILAVASGQGEAAGCMEERVKGGRPLLPKQEECTLLRAHLHRGSIPLYFGVGSGGW